MLLRALLANPNAAFLLLILGGLAIYRELASPGRVLPGVAGVFLVLAGGWGLLHDDLGALSRPLFYVVGGVFSALSALLLVLAIAARRRKRLG